MKMWPSSDRILKNYPRALNLAKVEFRGHFFSTSQNVFLKFHKETIFPTIKRIRRAVANHTSCRLQLCTNLPHNSLLTSLRCGLVRNWKDAGVAVARRVVCYGRVAATAALQMRLRLRCVSFDFSANARDDPERSLAGTERNAGGTQTERNAAKSSEVLSIRRCCGQAVRQRAAVAN